MVALFYFTELGAVLPLLNILFKSENPQLWISTKIDTIDQRITLLDAQAEEMEKIRAASDVGDRQAADLSWHFRR